MSNDLKNFMILGTQRTGSSALAEKLSLHPEIVCGWELTESWSVLRKVHVMEQALKGNFAHVPNRKRSHLETALRKEPSWLGFRRLFGATNKWILHPRYSAKLLIDLFESHLHWFKTNTNVHIIHIRRQDDLEWLKSKYVAAVTDSFSGQAYPDNLQVHIPCEAAKRRIESKYWIDDQLRTLANTNPYLEIVYEEFAKQPIQETTKALKLLGCDAREVSWADAVMKPQSRRKASNYISNVEEIERTIASVRANAVTSTAY